MTARQLLAIPRAIFADARSWLGYFGNRPSVKQPMWDDNWGWTGPGMTPHWERYFADPSDREARKNLISEWCRLSPQRAGKVASLLIVTAFLLASVIGLIVGVLI